MVWVLFLLLMQAPTKPSDMPHALYIGMVEVQHRAGEEKAILRVKVFQDDLQSCVRDAYSKGYIPGVGEPWLKANEVLVQRYFKKHLQCRISGKDVSLLYQRGEVLEDVYFLQFSLQCPAQWADIRVQADFFMELFPTQSNVVQVLCGNGVKRFGRTTKTQPFVSFSLSI